MAFDVSSLRSMVVRRPVKIIVPGNPMPAERARRGARGRWYTPERAAEYRERVQKAWLTAHAQSFENTPLSVSAQFYIARPKTHYGTGKNAGTLKTSATSILPPGDVDNYLKGLFDALQGLAFNNDRQIVCLSGINKHWATGCNPPHTAIDLWPAHRIAIPEDVAA
jgi:crossover junction endodeoxyribonuclease RusA